MIPSAERLDINSEGIVSFDFDGTGDRVRNYGNIERNSTVRFEEQTTYLEERNESARTCVSPFCP